jgi:alkylation response protein AidB-like acyl-CoA dehydrogenase
MDRVILNQELVRAKAPTRINALGLIIAAPTTMLHGTGEQKQRYLPYILQAEETWRQGFSAPNSGSALASLMSGACTQ